jgi:diphosphomevalonate decarboxylase
MYNFNNREEKINKRVTGIIDYFRTSCVNEQYKKAKLVITSFNTFPTAAGCASSASSMSCLVVVLNKLFLQTEDKQLLSSLARQGSGSACRSIFGGFVEWEKEDHKYKSIASQLFTETYWDLSVLLLVVSDRRKDIGSTDGMRISKETSELLKVSMFINP